MLTPMLDKRASRDN